jgi:hypothetical protein
MLKAKFGEAYVRYTSKVPALVPTLIPYTDGEKWPFSLQRLIDSKEHKPLFWMIILLVAFELKTRLLLEHKGMSLNAWLLVALCIALILLDILYEFNKKRIHAK